MAPGWCQLRARRGIYTSFLKQENRMKKAVKDILLLERFGLVWISMNLLLTGDNLAS